MNAFFSAFFFTSFILILIMAIQLSQIDLIWERLINKNNLLLLTRESFKKSLYIDCL